MKFLLIALLGITTAFAQSEPVTRIKGDNDASFKIAPNLKVPYKQATKINSTTARIETGNGNMLPDPSFESGVLPSNVIPTTAGEYAVACEGSGTRGIETNVLANDGTKVLKLMYGAGIGVGVGRCGIYFKVPDNLIGTNVELSFTGAVKYGTTICARSVQSISPFATQDGHCITTNDGVADKNKSFVFSITPIYDVVYLYFTKPNGDTATGTYRQAYIDTIYIGKPKSDEAIVAKFDNTTGWTPCTFSTLAWSGLGTVTNDLECKRDKDDLRISGTITVGTTSAAIPTIPMPTNYGTINHIYKANKRVGIYINNESSAYHGGAVLSYTGNTLAFADRATIGSFTLQALTPTNNGSNVSANGAKVSLELSIPIAEWSSQTNTALVACQEGPLKCYDDFTTHITTTSGVIDSTKNMPVIAPWFTSCTAANPTVCTINPAFNLINPLSCDADYLGSGGGQAYIAQVVGSTTTQVSIVTFASTNGANVASLKFKLSCSKVDGDRRNPNTTVTPMSDMNDVKSTEWVVGYDHIDNKPIYQRCHKVVSNVTTDNVTLATWPANLNPVNVMENGNAAGVWEFNGGNSSSFGTASILYVRATGVVRSWISGSHTLRAGSKSCLQYTK